MITYVASKAWTLIGVSMDEPSDGTRTRTENWRGPDVTGSAQQSTEQFLDSKKLGEQSNGVYLTEKRATGGGGPYGTADLIYTLAPDFERFETIPSSTLQTISVSGSAEGGNASIAPNAVSMDATRTKSYLAPQISFTYFASSKPEGPRFKSTGIKTVPETIYFDTVALTYELEDGTTRNKRFGPAFIPSQLSTQLHLPLRDVVQSFNAEPIPYTPWYRCTDVVAWGYFPFQ